MAGSWRSSLGGRCKDMGSEFSACGSGVRGQKSGGVILTGVRRQEEVGKEGQI